MQNLLQNLRCTEGSHLTRAAMMCFYPDPESWVTGAYIKIGFFATEADILYQDEIHGPLLIQVERAMDLIFTKYMKALVSYEGINRQERFFFPPDAFRELLLNAVVHKDYTETTPIQMRLLQFVWRGWEESRQHLSPFPRVTAPCSSRISA